MNYLSFPGLFGLFQNACERIMNYHIWVVHDLVDKLIHELALLVDGLRELRLALVNIFLVTLGVAATMLLI